jgi:hypothetical protein
MPYLGQAPKEPLEERTPEFPGMLAEAQEVPLGSTLLGFHRDPRRFGPMGTGPPHSLVLV